ncbi:MAG: homoserine kinase [Alphaproteobacteria bacterium]|nr:homoserine kinase [Alphaproteobacteria bacterium]
MAYVTNLSKKNIDYILLNYNILNYVNYTPIYDGIQNSNYIINTVNKKYILTIFEDSYVSSNINFFLNLLSFCNKNNFICPMPILDKYNNTVNYINKKPSCIFSFIEGESRKETSQHNIKNVGTHLAKLHIITNKFNEKIKVRFDINFYNHIIKKKKVFFSKLDIDLNDIFNDTLISYNSLYEKGLPKAIIHGDLFPDNVLFNNDNKITGFLDFYFSDYNYMISDLAIVIISWCFYINQDNTYVLNFNKVNVLLKSYNSIRKITNEEISALNIICKLYCMRFMFTRVIAKDCNYDKKRIFTKNPHEYIDKLLYFNDTNNLRMNINYA